MGDDHGWLYPLLWSYELPARTSVTPVLGATLAVLLGAPAAAIEAELGWSASIDHAEAQLARLATVLG